MSHGTKFRQLQGYNGKIQSIALQITDPVRTDHLPDVKDLENYYLPKRANEAKRDYELAYKGDAQFYDDVFTAIVMGK